MPIGCAARSVALLVLALLVSPSRVVLAQPVSVTTAGDALKIRAPRFTFLKGEPLARLKDGRSVRVEIAVLVLPGPGRVPLTTARRAFALSYDLWEERFAVTTVDSQPQRISHVSSAAAEAWCLDQLRIPLEALGTLGADDPFWIRLEYRILDGDGAANADGESVFTLQALIEALSRRRRTESSGDALEAGPFRLPRPGGAPSSPR